MNKVRDQDCLDAQLVVIGGGGSGLAAALTAAEKGVSKVVVLERRNRVGGNTALATGLFASGSPVQARQGVVADHDELFRRAMQWNHWNRVDARIVRAFIERSGDTIGWLERKGLTFELRPFFPEQELLVWHVPKGKGAALTRALAQDCQAKGVRILIGWTGRRILREPAGRVGGVLAENSAEGRSLVITARAVIVATGGFCGNPELLSKYCPDYYDGLPLRGLPHPGEGLLMAAEIGAEVEKVIALLIEGPRVDLNTWPLGGLERQPVTLWVNKHGQRFADESLGHKPFESVKAMLRQPEKISFTLFDSSIVTEANERAPGLEQALHNEIVKGRATVANSWDEIAGWIGCEPCAIENTVKEYNGFCHDGYDKLFLKRREFLRPLSCPPYYAIKCRIACLDTLGGLRVNASMQVMDVQGAPIPGLYAAGVVTSGWQSEHYSGDLSGSAFGYAITSGRIAGECASRQIVGAQ